MLFFYVIDRSHIPDEYQPFSRRCTGGDRSPGESAIDRGDVYPRFYACLSYDCYRYIMILPEVIVAGLPPSSGYVSLFSLFSIIEGNAGF